MPVSNKARARWSAVSPLGCPQPKYCKTKGALSPRAIWSHQIRHSQLSVFGGSHFSAA